jgi:hypothetical protein
MERDEKSWVPYDETQVKAVPWADRPCDEIIPGLWMGGHHYYPEVGWPVVIGDEFDAVFSLHHGFGHGPAEGVPHEYLSMPDGQLSPERLDRVRNFAGKVYDTYTFDVMGQVPKILVRCQAGYNRSGLVVGLVLLRLGYDPVSAVELIREKRGPHALCNAYFVSYLDKEWSDLRGN